MATIVNTPQHDHNDNSTLVLGVVIALVALLMIYFFLIAPGMRGAGTTVVTPPAPATTDTGDSIEINPQIPDEVDVNVNFPTTVPQQ